MKPLKAKVIEGTACDASGSSDRVLVTIARAGHAADELEVFTAPAWERVAVGPWPAQHALVALQGDVLVTTHDGAVHAWRLAL